VDFTVLVNLKDIVHVNLDYLLNTPSGGVTRRHDKSHWIPAFAGMTEKGNILDLLRWHLVT